MWSEFTLPGHHRAGAKSKLNMLSAHTDRYEWLVVVVRDGAVSLIGNTFALHAFVPEFISYKEPDI